MDFGTPVLLIIQLVFGPWTDSLSKQKISLHFTMYKEALLQIERNIIVKPLVVDTKRHLHAS